jgi:hypothetical protein
MNIIPRSALHLGGNDIKKKDGNIYVRERIIKKSTADPDHLIAYGE